MKSLFFLFGFCLVTANLVAQLRPGYNFDEAREFLKINFQFIDSIYLDSVPAPQRFYHTYRSPDLGFDNSVDFWRSDDTEIGCLSFRGTTGSFESWASNFYSSMIPAKGQIQLPNGFQYNYCFAQDSLAAVHEGWTISIAYMWQQIDSLVEDFVAQGGRDLVIAGHSQGGALATMVSAQFQQLKLQGKLPEDLRLKTYTVAAPKSGNLFFAYEYEHLTQFGWSFNTVNPLDWVPTTPFTVTTTRDFNRINPFANAMKSMNGLPMLPQMYLKHAFRKMDRPTRKSHKRFEKYLGNRLKRMLLKKKEGLVIPKSVKSFAYVRIGQQILLQPDENYLSLYPQEPTNYFLNHGIEQYIYLINLLEEKSYTQ
jgi:pimeloyl-ACP methyl ester carboxylesterase